MKNNSLTGKDVKDRKLVPNDIKPKSLTAGQIAPDSITGAEIAESSLALNLKQPISFGVVTIAEGAADQTLLTTGPFTLFGRCADNAGETEGSVLVRTTENGSAFAGDDEEIAPLNTNTPVADTIIEDPGAETSAMEPFAVSEGYDDQFTGMSPSGFAVQGTVSTTADRTSQQCKFAGNAITNG